MRSLMGSAAIGNGVSEIRQYLVRSFVQEINRTTNIGMAQWPTSVGMWCIRCEVEPWYWTRHSIRQNGVLSDQNRFSRVHVGGRNLYSRLAIVSLIPYLWIWKQYVGWREPNGPLSSFTLGEGWAALKNSVIHIHSLFSIIRHACLHIIKYAYTLAENLLPVLKLIINLPVIFR